LQTGIGQELETICQKTQEKQLCLDKLENLW